ncbi:ROK family transcriptional regulator [Alkalihalobacillus sp. 1P02AB]|uniref:ROK family transcriptional regulator n=1 Tax=Alkalihalobacillus sp. 1P02AB TaxID=3132260 RepID=UPI0039A64BB6
MDDFSVIDIKKTNYSNIFHLLYNSKKRQIKISKQDIAYKLNLSLPTVTQNIRALISQDLIIEEGKFSSKGGRKAIAYSLNSSAKIALGVEISKQEVKIVSLDLLGNVTLQETKRLAFQYSDTYFECLADFIKSYIHNRNLDKSRILGIGLGIQGLISHDGRTVLYGKILNCTGLDIKAIAKYLDFPCRFVHDAECVATAEQWVEPEIKEAIILSVGEHLGGALIMNGQPYNGANGRSGTIEHTILNPSGPECYCGKKGCVEVYCSLNALALQYGSTMEEFINCLRNGDKRANQIWYAFMDSLAMAINNFHMFLDNQVIIGGDILNFITKEDLLHINQLVKDKSAFPDENKFISLGKLTNDAVAIGAALPLIKEYIDTL